MYEARYFDFQTWLHLSSGCFYGFSLLLFIYQLKMKANALQIWLKWLMAFVLVVNTLCMFVFYGYNIFGRTLQYDVNMLQLLVIPACSMLLYEIVNPGRLTWSMVLLSISPFAALWMMSHLNNIAAVYMADMGLAVLFALASFLYAAIKVHRFDRMLRLYYSNIERRDLHWLSVILAEFILLLAVWTGASLYSTTLGDAAYNLLSCLLWYSLCFFVNRQKIIVFDKDTPKPSLDPSNVSQTPLRISDEARYHFAERFSNLIEKERRFLDPELTLSDLAKELNTNRTYLSQYLNNVLETNFYDYINGLRISHAARLLGESDDKVEYIAALSGYSNPSTFRRLFCKIQGCSPSEYRVRMKDKKEFSLGGMK